jgi:hypothetical protein
MIDSVLIFLILQFQLPSIGDCYFYESEKTKKQAFKINFKILSWKIHLRTEENHNTQEMSDKKK